MRLFHVSSCNFQTFDVEKMSRFGDYGEGFYCYCSEKIRYGIRTGNFVLEFEINEPIIKPFDGNKSFEQTDCDLIQHGDVIVIKQSGLAKLKFKSSNQIVEATSIWDEVTLFELENGTIMANGKY